VCVCDRIRRVDHRTRITVLQHPGERSHPIGTARFIELGLSRGRVWTVPEIRKGGSSLPFEPGAGAALLYPSRDARDLASLSPGEHPDELVLLDGTWDQARTLYRDFPALHDLPHRLLSPPEPSRYRIRREPRADYVSTLEAAVHALRILEPDVVGLDRLLAAFDSMVDDQLGFVARSTGRRHHHVPLRPIGARGLPRALVEEASRLVAAWAEWSPGPDGRVVLLQLAAFRFRDGAGFERFTPESAGLSPGHRRLLGWPPSPAETPPADDVAAAWSDFAGRDACVGVWSQSLADVIGPLAPRLPMISLKAAYRTVRPEVRGGLDCALAHESLRPDPPAWVGRAGRRLAGSLALVAWLRSRESG
jgi:hypothetical protein